MNLRQIAVVTRFELQDALRSRFVLGVVLVFSGGAGLGCYFFFQTLAAVSNQIRESLLASGATPDQLGEDLVREQALPRLIHSAVADAELAEQLVQVAPLALFYAWGAFLLAAPLALFLSAGKHAQDRELGVTRYLLTRTDRGSWALGKLLGQGLLLGLGIALGACVTAVVALRYSSLDAGSAMWLANASVRAWTYSVSYLCLFAGASLVASSASRARALSLILLFVLWLGRAVVQSDWAAAALPGSHWLVWLFPAQYKLLLWSPDILQSFMASVALLVLGATGFAVGSAIFQRRDA